MIALDILTDGFFAAVAGIGFGAISDPPLRAFKMIAILAALGHACRFCLMNYLGMDIATGSLFAGLVIGFGSLWLGKKVYCPMTVLYIPALLPNAASMAIILNARKGGSEIAPNPIPATAAKNPSVRMSSAIISN